jgi:hypothetical protein
MLHALAKKLLTNAQKPEYGNLPVGTLTFAEPYPQLRFGDVAGIGQVTIDQTGNMVGFSPVERCTAGGETAWIPLELIKNIRLDPIGVGTRGHAATNTTPSSGARLRSRTRTTKTAAA